MPQERWMFQRGSYHSVLELFLTGSTSLWFAARRILLLFLIRFIYGLFNDAVSNLEYIAANSRVINKRLIG
jgi:hypothetical protein